MSRPLRIAHAVLRLDVGGLERAVVGLAGAAARAGHAVAVVCVEAPGHLAPDAAAAGAEVVSLGKPPGRRPEAVAAAARALADWRPDIVHTHQLGAVVYAGRAAAEAGTPVVHTEHGNPVARAGSLRAVLAYRLRFRQSVRWVRRYCGVSPEIAAALTRWRTVPAGRVAVVPNGVPLDPPAGLPAAADVRAGLGIPADAPVVGTVGRLAEVKRQDLLLRAFAEVRKRVPAAHLVLVGDGPERPALERLAAGLGLADAVRFAGHQPRPEAYLRAVDVFALTSRSEGFPMSLLEAWAAARPVVCTAVGGIPAVVSDGADGLLVPSGDVGWLAAALGDLLADPAAAGRMGAAGRQTVVAKYSLDRVAAGYDRLYRGAGAG